MNDLSRICAAAREAEARRHPIWLATVMRVKGSAYRHAGARMLFSSDQVLAGSVSGGCLEASIARKGPWLARERPVCVSYEGGRDTDDGESPRGTGCDGTVDILLEKVSFDTPGSVLDALHGCLAHERRCAVVTVYESSDPALPVGTRLTLDEGGELSAPSLRGPAVAAFAAFAAAAARALDDHHSHARTLRVGGIEALLEVFEPPPHLFVFGSGPDAVPVVEFASGLGLGVTVCDPNPRVAVRERFAALAELHLGSLSGVLPKIRVRRTPLAVVMSHHYPTDLAALRLLLDSPAAYLGLLGPLRRTERMLNELFPDASELRTAARARMHAPIGLDLGAETPPQIALSIVAEIQAVLARASAEPLSHDTARPIHRAEGALELPLASQLGLTGTE